VDGIVRRIEADIRAEASEAMGVAPKDVVVAGVDEWVREQLRDLWMDTLSETVAKIEGLTGQRDELIRWLVGSGVSSRRIAGIVGVSHTSVLRIAHGEQ